MSQGLKPVLRWQRQKQQQRQRPGAKARFVSGLYSV